MYITVWDSASCSFPFHSCSTPSVQSHWWCPLSLFSCFCTSWSRATLSGGVERRSSSYRCPSRHRNMYRLRYACVCVYVHVSIYVCMHTHRDVHIRIYWNMFLFVRILVILLFIGFMNCLFINLFAFHDLCLLISIILKFSKTNNTLNINIYYC